MKEYSIAFFGNMSVSAESESDARKQFAYWQRKSDNEIAASSEIDTVQLIDDPTSTKAFDIRISFDTVIKAETEEQAIKLAFKAADENGFDVCIDGYGNLKALPATREQQIQERGEEPQRPQPKKETLARYVDTARLE